MALSKDNFCQHYGSSCSLSPSGENWKHLTTGGRRYSCQSWGRWLKEQCILPNVLEHSNVAQQALATEAAPLHMVFPCVYFLSLHLFFMIYNKADNDSDDDDNHIYQALTVSNTCINITLFLLWSTKGAYYYICHNCCHKLGQVHITALIFAWLPSPEHNTLTILVPSLMPLQMMSLVSAGNVILLSHLLSFLF